MTASERVKIIKAISSLLSKEEWHLIDLTLRQFQLPTSDEWSGTSGGYIITMVSNASDDVLLELASHLGIESTPRPSALTPSFWFPGHLRLFISHLAEHKKEVGLLKSMLESYGISAFIAHVDIEPTKPWQSEIELALSTADAVVAILTPGFHESKWTDQEIGFALGRGLLVITLKMGLDPYGFMGHEQALSCGELNAALAQSIFEILVEHKQTIKRMAQAVVKLFVASNSFAEAKKNVALLERVEYWDKQLAEEVAFATEANSQIRESFGVPTRVRAFLEKWQYPK